MGIEIILLIHTLRSDLFIQKQLCERHFYIKRKISTDNITWKALYKSRVPLLREIHALQLSAEDLSSDLVVLESPFTLRYIGHDSDGDRTVGISFTSLIFLLLSLLICP